MVVLRIENERDLSKDLPVIKWKKE